MRALWGSIVGVGTAVALAVPGAAAAAQPKLHECQHPLRTGVEVFTLHDVSVRTACPVALSLFAYEGHPGNIVKLYGCHRPHPNAGGYPYLRAHSFDGWRISLAGRDRDFTLTRGRSSFAVTGTDFPLNCS